MEANNTNVSGVGRYRQKRTSMTSMSLHEMIHTTRSPLKMVQRRCNYGLTNAEWNALSYEQRDALNTCARALDPRRLCLR